MSTRLKRSLCGLARATRERLAGVLGVSADALLEKVDEVASEAGR